MTHVTCRLTAKNRVQLRNPMLGNRVWAAFTFLWRWWWQWLVYAEYYTDCCMTCPMVCPTGASTAISIEQHEQPAQQLQPNTHLKSRRTRITSCTAHIAAALGGSLSARAFRASPIFLGPIYNISYDDLTIILRSAKVTIDLRRTSNLSSILRRTQGFS